MALNRHTETKIFAFLLLWAVGTALLCLFLRLEPLFEIESKTWDWRLQTIAARGDIDPDIKLILIDQTSIDFFANHDKISWPWPRSLYNPILFYLKKAGAKGIAFDMLFTEEGLYYGDDDGFAEALRTTIPVVSALSLRRTGIEGNQEVLELLRGRQNAAPPFERRYLEGLSNPRLGYGAIPIKSILESSPAIGNVWAEPDSDKVYRHTLPGAYLNTIPLLNLPFALYHLLHPTSEIPEQLKVLADDQGRYLVRFHGGAATYPSYSAHAIIQSWIAISEGREPEVPLSDFKDAYVFLGTNAPALLDLRPVPLSGNYPGVELNATVFDNILHQNFLQKVPWGWSLLIGSAAIAFGAAGGMFFTHLQVPVLAAVYLAWIGICFMAGNLGWWLPMMYPLVSMILVTLGSLVFQYRFEGRQHRFIKNAFEYYVTPEVIDKIVADPSRLTLGGERRELTIYFSDIAGFTTLSEKMEPAKLVQFLNKFLSEMTDIILKSGGTIDKYEGDAIIAFWNAPLSVPDHRQRAIKAALECQRRLYALAPYFKREFDVDVRMRVGLNTGFVTVGNFGSSTRFNYTIIGDAANLASRLEGANKVFGTYVLLSGMTKDGGDSGVLFRKLGDITVVGKAEVVSVYEPLDPVLQQDKIDQLPLYEQALAAFEAGDLQQAEEHFRRIENDPTSSIYLERIAKERAHGFSGHVWNLKEK